jgi:hypothetical protein
MSAQPSFEVLDLNADSLAEQQRHAEALRKYEARARARTVIVPTAIEDVKRQLREMGHPITLFGETAMDRRERLREVIAALELDDEELQRLQAIINQRTGAGAGAGDGGQAANRPAAAASAPGAPQPPAHQQREIVYSSASQSLIDARRFIADYSFERAHTRIANTKRARDSEDSVLADDLRVLGLYTHHKDVCLNMSQYGDERPLTSIRFAPGGGEYVATGSLSCGVKIFNVSYKHANGSNHNSSSSSSSHGKCVTDMAGCASLRGHHTERVTSVSWHPHSFAQDNNSNVGWLAASSADSTCSLWRCSNNPNDASSDDSNGTAGINSSSQFVSSTQMNVDKDGEDSDGDSEDSGDHVANNHNMQVVDQQTQNQPTNSNSSEGPPLHCRMVTRLAGHRSAVNWAEFHPSGRLVGTASAGKFSLTL